MSQAFSSGLVFGGSVGIGDGINLDAFDRLRVSETETIFDSKLIYDAAPLFWDDVQTSGTATSTHSVNQASVTLGVSASTAGVRTRQTFMRFNYQPGKSQLIFMTFVLDKTGGGTGITRRVGYFDADNGLFLEDAAGTYKLVRRSKASGSIVDDGIAQSAWNLDKLDGTGVSGINLDFSKAQILVTDFEWLGVGRVRMGFVVDGVIRYAHQFLNANNLSVVYMSTPNLPLRYELTNSGAGVASTLECICASVMSEGGFQRNGILRHKDSAALTGLATGVKYAVVGLKLKSPYSATVLIENVSALCTTVNDFAHWELIFNPTVAGTFTYSDLTNSTVQTATGTNANTITGGYELGGGYFSTNAPPTSAVENALRLGSTIAGVADSIVLSITPVTNNISAYGSITWREL